MMRMQPSDGVLPGQSQLLLTGKDTPLSGPESSDSLLRRGQPGRACVQWLEGTLAKLCLQQSLWLQMTVWLPSICVPHSAKVCIVDDTWRIWICASLRLMPPHSAVVQAPGFPHFPKGFAHLWWTSCLVIGYPVSSLLCSGSPPPSLSLFSARLHPLGVTSTHYFWVICCAFRR